MAAPNHQSDLSIPAQAAAARRTAIRGDLLDFTGDPGSQTDLGAAVRFVADGWLLVEGERILDTRPADFVPDASWQIDDRRGHLICPGFIDTHVHCSQLDVVASYGTTLLQWLERYTFPNERRFADPEFAQREARLFCDYLLANATTTAMVFPTVHAGSAHALFQAADERRMCLIGGNVLMNQHCPADLQDPADLGEAKSRELIRRWHQTARLHYAITPRFAPTSTSGQLAMAGRLVKEVEGLYVQSHVSENQDEVQWVRELFPEDRSYLAVYERFGLLNDRAVLAHGIWLDDADRRLLADRGTTIAFCPGSNLFLGSGCLDVQATQQYGAMVALASDLGGGTQLNMLRVMADASHVMALTGQKLTAFRAFYLATRGAAKALQLDGQIGSLTAGSYADLAVLRWSVSPLQARRQQLATDVHERLFALMMQGSEHHVAATYVAGEIACASN